MIEALFQYTFMRNAFLAAILASVVTGIIGSIAIEKRLISMSGGIAHASFGGIGLGYLLGFEPIWGGLGFAIGSSVLIAKLSDNKKVKSDTLTGVLWAFGMALGILFISLAPGYMPDMTSYLFGDILSVSTDTLWYMAAFTVVIILVLTTFYHHIMIYLFDESYAKAKGIPVHILKWMVYLMIPVGIIVVVKIVGIVLAIALLTIPSSIAKLYAKSLRNVIVHAVIISTVFCLSGLTLSYYISIPSGVCIILLSTVIYLVVLGIKSISRRNCKTVE